MRNEESIGDRSSTTHTDEVPHVRAEDLEKHFRRSSSTLEHPLGDEARRWPVIAAIWLSNE